ncbi:MAG: metallophosphoesterase [Cyanobacteriota bacterium]|nr:metallophosphoesterase [Cyanobacteriota bacterium]
MTLTRRRCLSLAVGASLGLASWRQALAAAATRPAPLPPARGSWRLGLISDLNASYGATHYVAEVARGVELLQRLRPDLVLCAGDMVAGQKLSLNTQQLDAMWAAFARQVLDPLRQSGLPFAPVIGNHDGSATGRQGRQPFERERDRARRFWQSRLNKLGLNLIEASDFPFHYSFQQGEALVAVIDASAAALAPTTLPWLDRQLQRPEARKARLRLVVGHLPLAAVAQGRDSPGEVLADPSGLRRLLERHRVTLYISGHHHAYFPGRSGQLDVLSLGAMGSGPRRLLLDSRTPHQTLTLLDRFGEELVDTTIDLTRLQPIDRTRLPLRLQPRQGVALDLRSPRWRLN